MFKYDDPILEDGDLGDLPRAAGIGRNGADIGFGSVRGIEEESVIGAGLKVAERCARIGCRRKCDYGLAGDVSSKGLPVILLAPTRFDEVRLRLEFPPGVAHEQ